MTPLIKAARYPLWLGTDMDAILDYVEQSAGDSVDIESLKHLFSTDRSSYVKKSYVNDKEENFLPSFMRSGKTSCMV